MGWRLVQRGHIRQAHRVEGHAPPGLGVTAEDGETIRWRCHEFKPPLLSVPDHTSAFDCTYASYHSSQWVLGGVPCQGREAAATTAYLAKETQATAVHTAFCSGVLWHGHRHWSRYSGVICPLDTGAKPLPPTVCVVRTLYSTVFDALYSAALYYT